MYFFFTWIFGTFSREFESRPNGNHPSLIIQTTEITIRITITVHVSYAFAATLIEQSHILIILHNICHVICVVFLLKNISCHNYYKYVNEISHIIPPAKKMVTYTIEWKLRIHCVITVLEVYNMIYIKCKLAKRKSLNFPFF